MRARCERSGPARSFTGHDHLRRPRDRDPPRRSGRAALQRHARRLRPLRRLPRRPARPLPGARLGRAADAGRAGGGGRDRRALRPRVARAAGRDRHPRRSTGRARLLASARPRRGAASTRRASRSPLPSRASPRRCARPLPELVEAFRTGAGIPYADYGEDLCGAQASFTRPLFEQLLGSEWLPSIPDVDARLLAAPPARVADLACGAGHSSIAIARAYPRVLVTGSISTRPRSCSPGSTWPGAGWRTASTFVLGDAAYAAARRPYDLVTVFEALHDMSRPGVGAAARRGSCSPTAGRVIVADERVADSFSAPGDDVERLYYGFSVAALPAGRDAGPRPGTGAVMRVDTVRSLRAATPGSRASRCCRSTTTSGASTG